MPCKHIERIKEIIRPYHMISNEKWDNEVGKGNCHTSHANYEGNFWFKNDRGGLISYLNDINSSSYEEVKRLVRECSCKNAEELESESRNQLILRRNAETERNDLQRERDRLQSSNWSLQSINTTLQNQLTQKNKDIEWGKNELTRTQRDRDDYKNKWVLSDKEVKKITDSFNALQIEKSKKETEIASLQEELESLQNVDLRYKDRKLDELIRNAGLNRPRVMDLRDAYIKLHNRDDVANANREIETIKNEFFQTNVAINDLHKIYKTCEKIAELKVKQEKLREQQQQYEARQEQPTK